MTNRPYLLSAVLAAAALALSGCQSYLNHKYPPGQMGPDGKVYPCNDRRMDHQACGEAIYNAPRVRRLELGQTIAEARAIMGRDPERRSLKTTPTGKPVEQWGYLTDYDNTVVSVITFTDGRIAAVEAVPQAEE